MGKYVERTRNNNTQTEAQFWGMVRSALRNATRYWKPRLLALQNAKRKYTGTNKKQKWEYQCYVCKEYFIQKEIEVDHVIPVGSLRCKEDLPQFVENLFCEENNLKCICKKCHKEKTHNKVECEL